MWKDKIALQLYSVRDDLQQDFYGTLQKVKEMGYRAVEFAGLYGNTPADVKNMCDELGLIPLSAHVPFLDLRDHLQEIVDDYAVIGCKYIVVPYLTEDFRPGNPGFSQVLEALPDIAKAATDKGMVLQYHNHDFEFVKLDGQYALDLIYETVGPELLQTQIDTCWVNVAGEDPAAYLRKYSGRTPTVHLKDFAGCRTENMYALIGIDEDKKKASSGKFEFRPLGKGLQNIHAIIQAALESGAQWFIVEQDSPSMELTPLECASVSIQYLLQL